MKITGPLPTPAYPNKPSLPEGSQGPRSGIERIVESLGETDRNATITSHPTPAPVGANGIPDFQVDRRNTQAGGIPGGPTQ